MNFVDSKKLETQLTSPFVKQFRGTLENALSIFYTTVKKIDGNYRDYLPEKKAELQLQDWQRAQLELWNKMEALAKTITDDLQKAYTSVWEKKFPEAFKTRNFLALQDAFNSSYTQTQTIMQLLKSGFDDEEILYFVRHFISQKRYDSVFLIEDILKIEEKNREVKGNVAEYLNRKPIINELTELLKPVKDEIGITELEGKIEMLESFLNNLKAFLTALNGVNLGAHIRDIHSSVTNFLRMVYPEFYNYIMQRSYPNQQF